MDVVQKSRLITEVPDVIDQKESWLVDYWATTLGVSSGRLKQCIALVGPKATKIRTLLEKGHRIALEDTTGTIRLIGRITMLSDGFSLLVPYYPAKEGCLFKTPIDYSSVIGVAPVTEIFTVSDTVKLSLHMTGFAHFSTAGAKPVISGYCEVLKKPKGIGLKAPQEIDVSSGPLCGFMVQGLEEFTPLGKETAEVFHREDLWYHPDYPGESGTYNVEIFMLPLSTAAGAQGDSGKRTVKLQLPFMGRIKFPHTLRIIELRGLSFALGVIISPSPRDSSIVSGYKLASPGVGEPGAQKYAITAWYPRPPMLKDHPMASLDFVRSEPADEANEP
jgi:hypothetical protein